MIQPLSSTSRVMKVGLSSEDKSTQALIEAALIAYWTVRPRLMRVPGVANVAIWGDSGRCCRCRPTRTGWRRHGVALNSVMDASADALDVGVLRFSSGHEIGTGGFFDTPNQRLGIRHILPNITATGLAGMPVDAGDGGQVRIGDVATVVREHQPHLNGDAIIDDGVGLMLIVEKLPWGNTVEVTRGVEEALTAMQPGLPGIRVDTTIFRPATFIETSIDNLGRAMILGFILVSLILLFFLFEWRVALISLVTIPLSLVAAGLVLATVGATINTMILAGLRDRAGRDRRRRDHRHREHRAAAAPVPTRRQHQVHRADRPRRLARGPRRRSSTRR